MNKKGQMGIIIFFIILLLILIIGFIAVMATSIIDYASDELTPIMQDLGVDSGNAGFEEGLNTTTSVTSSVVGAMPWLISFAYVLALIFSVVFIFLYRENPSPAFFGFYIILLFLLVLGCIVMSNIYQDIYEGDDVFALRLQENFLMSYLILYSPFIMTVIAIIGGIIMFSGISESGGQI